MSTIGVAYNAIEAEEFVEWLNAHGHTASIVNQTEDTLDGRHAPGALNELWEQYCNGS